MFNTMQEVITANEAIGHCWFSPKTKRFFKSRIGSTLYGGKYFISSEQFGDNSPRLYSVRYVYPRGNITTVGNFQQYVSRGDALRAIEHLLERGIG